MKITPKYQTGGFLDSLDNSLNKLGTWGRLGVEMVDPTGITAWKPTKEAAEAFIKSGSLMDAGSLALNALGAIPMFSAFKAVPKLGDLIKSGKLLKKSKYLLDPDFAKDLVNPAKELNIPSQLAKDTRAQQEAVRLLDDAILKEVKSAQDKNMKKLSQSQEEKVYKLAEKKATILDQDFNPQELIANINSQLT